MGERVGVQYLSTIRPITGDFHLCANTAYIAVKGNKRMIHYQEASLNESSGIFSLISLRRFYRVASPNYIFTAI